MRLTSSSEPQAPVIDLLFASSGIEPEVVADAESIELLPNLTMGVARTGHLIALKVLSRDDVSRPQDLVTTQYSLQAPAQRIDVNGPGQSMCAALVVGGVAWIEPSEKPCASLRV